mmetsp:Transcript_16817/g.63779  ORF Transcript_16817/g.63779 Transcript_16817/m.63779 type:complete len:383 (+) Transcript_16817:865-2013(+)
MMASRSSPAADTSNASAAMGFTWKPEPSPERPGLSAASASRSISRSTGSRSVGSAVRCGEPPLPLPLPLPLPFSCPFGAGLELPPAAESAAPDACGSVALAQTGTSRVALATGASRESAPAKDVVATAVKLTCDTGSLARDPLRAPRASQMAPVGRPGPEVASSTVMTARRPMHLASALGPKRATAVWRQVPLGCALDSTASEDEGARRAAAAEKRRAESGAGTPSTRMRSSAEAASASAGTSTHVRPGALASAIWPTSAEGGVAPQEHTRHTLVTFHVAPSAPGRRSMLEATETLSEGALGRSLTASASVARDCRPKPMEALPLTPDCSGSEDGTSSQSPPGHRAGASASAGDGASPAAGACASASAGAAAVSPVAFTWAS